MKSIKIGISACLTGQEVRFDKSHKQSSFCMDQLAKFVEYKPVCPEMAVGLPTPRQTVRQIKKGDVIHVSRPDGSGDITNELIEYGNKIAKQSDELAGFIFTAKSPSCGMERVRVYNEEGTGAEKVGIGLFAEQIMKHNPLLPCEENGRLNDPLLRENFVMRVFVYQEWLNLKTGALTQESVSKKVLYDFHASHKYLLMAHNVPAYKALGKLLAQSNLPVTELAEEYIFILMTALKQKATRKSHSNALLHIMGYFKKHLDRGQKKELLEQIEHFRIGLQPLLVPLTLINHHLKANAEKFQYLQKQSYLQPYPLELRLRYGY
jgi:uncharacterized protein YbgA (DUF1722 family)/uncharacterized protein YbbK (DUF523 family)